MSNIEPVFVLQILILIILIRILLLVNRDVSPSVNAHFDAIIKQLEETCANRTMPLIHDRSSISRTSDRLFCNIEFSSPSGEVRHWAYEQLKNDPSYFEWFNGLEPSSSIQLLKSFEKSDTVSVYLYTEARFNFMKLSVSNNLYFRVCFLDRMLQPFQAPSLFEKKMSRKIRRELSKVRVSSFGKIRDNSVSRIVDNIFDTISDLSYASSNVLYMIYEDRS